MKNFLAFIISFALAFSPLAAPLAHATPVSWDKTSGLLQPLLSSWNDEVRVPYLTATSTTATSTFKNVSITGPGVSLLGEYFTNFTNYTRSLFSAGSGLDYAAGVFSVEAGGITNAMLQNSTISGVSLGSNLADLTATNGTLTFSGAYNGGTARTIGLNLGNANTWTGAQTIAASLFNLTGLSDGCLQISSNLLTSTGSACGSGGGAVAWGDITGTLSAQTDLQTALDAKVPAARTLTASTGLTGGGDLSANRSFALSAGSIASLALADSALQSGDNVSELVNDAGYTTNTGTVSSVAATVPTGLLVSGSPITTTGTLAFTFDTGYAIPTTAKQTEWDTAYTNRITSANSPLSIATNAISIANAAADGTTKGAASFTAADFNASSGNISIDYTNGQAAASGVKGFLTAADWATFNGKEEVLTFGDGLTRTLNDVDVDTTQNIAKLSNLTSNGFVKTSAGDGTLSVDTNTYLTGNQTITLSGAVSGSGATSITTTYNDVVPAAKGGAGTLSGLLKANGAGVVSAAVAGTDYYAPGGTDVAVADGGTNISSYTTGDLLYASAGTTLTKRAIGTTGDVLSVVGGVPTWVATSSLSIAASPAGSSSYVQFNLGGVFGAVIDFVWDNTNKRLGVGTSTPQAQTHVVDTGTLIATTTTYSTAGTFTYTPPANVLFYQVYMWGGGGAGGYDGRGGGGGAGAYVATTTSVATTSVQIFVAGGGTNNNNNSSAPGGTGFKTGGNGVSGGGGGGSSSFGGIIIACGGGGGAGNDGNGGSAASGTSGGAGGSPGGPGSTGGGGGGCNTNGSNASGTSGGAGGTGGTTASRTSGNGSADIGASEGGGGGSAGGATGNGTTASTQAGAVGSGGATAGSAGSGFDSGGGGNGGNGGAGQAGGAPGAGGGGGDDSAAGNGGAGKVIIIAYTSGGTQQDSLFTITGAASTILQKIEGVIMGVAYTFEKLDKFGHLFTGGPPPIANSCTGFSATGNDRNGVITFTAATSCSIIFANTWGTTPVCVVTPTSGNIATSIQTISATGFTVSSATNISGFRYICQGVQ